MAGAAGNRAGGRIAVLDLIRGVAILGILAVNVEGFAGPIAATVTPDWNGPVSGASHLAFAAVMVLFEGKMRALLSLLFGASMLLFIESAEQAGRNGDTMQLRRICWLAVIGFLHFGLLWWGDILFTYAFAGFFALLLRHLPVKAMAVAALLAFCAWHGQGIVGSIDPVRAEMRLASGTASSTERVALVAERDQGRREALAEQRREQGGYLELMRHKLVEEAGLPLTIATNTLGESLSLMLLGMTLYRSGFFTGGWSRQRLRLLAVAGIGSGGIVTLGLTALAWTSGFPPRMMNAMLAWWMALPHLAMALGYAALLVLASQTDRIGRMSDRIVAVGRMALSNYLACTLVMTGLFYGWGLGLAGHVPESCYWIFVVAGWLGMLAVSKPWLARYRQGPVEWAWRSLTNWQLQPFRR